MPAKKIFTEPEKQTILSMFGDNCSLYDIAKVIGCAKNTVRGFIISNGFVFDKSKTVEKIRKKATGRKSAAKGRVRSVDEIEKQKKTRVLNKKPFRRGYKHSESTLIKISLALKGKNRKYSDSERREIESVRCACKRFVNRVLNKSGLRKNKTKTEVLLGYTKWDLMLHLGEKPTKDCHIDHYVPISEFFRRGIFDPKIINALPNLRWLDAHENRKKSDSVPIDADEVIQKCISHSPIPRVVRF